MPSRQRKRPRKDSKDNNGDRPAPPPPAPPSLVKLLKKDQKVLEYFRSLQENLSYDVEKWKKRSHAYKEELEELKLVQEPPTRTLSSKAPIEAKDNNKNKKKKAKDASSSTRINASGSQLTDKATHIDDSAFDFELSSSSDEDDKDKDLGDNRKPQHSMATRKRSSNGATKSYKFNVDEEDDDCSVSLQAETATDTKAEHGSKDKLVPNHIRIGWKFLRKAEAYLNEIGIVLANTILIDECDDNTNDDVDGNSISTSNENNPNEASAGNNGVSAADNISNNATDTTINDDEAERKSRPYTSFIRRSDIAVLGDIVDTIKGWTKLKINVDFPLQGSDILNETNKDRSGDGTGDVATTAKNTFRHRYAAFESRERIPCFMPLPDHLLGDHKIRNTQDENSGKELSTAPQHPAVRGVEMLLCALAWIDAFGSILDEIEIDDYDKNNGSGDDARDEQDTVGSYYAQLVASENDGITIDPSSNESEGPLSSAILFVTGMKKRYVMVRKFVKSLVGEICDTWPLQDRFDLHRNTALHDDRDHSNGNSVEYITDEVWEETRLVVDSKNSIRLASMAERCILARIVTSIHLHRSDPSSALDFLFRYVLVTVPSIELENYPKHPPVQSLLIIEAILNSAFPRDMNDKTDSGRTLFDYLLQNPLKSESKDSNTVLQVLELALATSAFIFRIRMSHEDTRISEPGFIEEAAYRRILSCFKNRGVQTIDTEEPRIGPDSSLHSYNQKCTRLIQNFLENSMQRNGKTAFSPKVLMRVIPTASSLRGNSKILRNIFLEWSEIYLSSKSSTALMILEGISKALRQLEIRSADSYRAVINSSSTTEIKTSVQSTISRFADLITAKVANENENEDPMEITNLSILMRICHELADGESALRFIEWWLKRKTITGNSRKSVLEEEEYSSFFNYWSAFPMVRVINLERREDRMAAFMAQAMHAGLWAIRGVIPPDRWQAMRTTEAYDHSFASYIGTFAIDGSQGSPAEVETKLMDWIELGGHTNGSAKKELDSLVKPQWRPNDLRAFDVHASDDPTFLVSLSPSEKACALSHIATWKGISSGSFANSFTYTGFARGDPIHDSVGRVGVDHISPCPVALVLEDDAVLVDRFQERLDQLLEELPRDFHYCALGYARPKEAPLLEIPGCEYIKLPTMTWYLTGYLLSQSGAQYLLDQLPVEGPVDSWIGGKMILTSNWENEFGHRVGVGDAPQRGVDYVRPTLSLKEIRMCVKFRAYCASVPLCDQKVRTATAMGASASRQEKPIQNWRLRDSDIVYSGNVGTANRKRKNNS